MAQMLPEDPDTILAMEKIVPIGLIPVHWLNPHDLAIFDLYRALCNFLVTSVEELDHKKMIIWCL